MKNKIQQFFLAFLICVIGTSFHPKYGIGIALTVAILKNLKDSAVSECGWSWGAIAAALAGGTAGFVAYIAIDQMDLIHALLNGELIDTVMSAVESILP